jgi:PRTRC genetic system ThiF family protein
MQKHIVSDLFINPVHKITIDVIGAGGTGSHVLGHLGRIHKALVALEHPGLFVRMIDDDKVDEANLGRQNFSPAHLGMYKGDALIQNINRFYGTDWASVPKKIQDCELDEHGANIIIGCVDSGVARIEIEKAYFYLSERRGRLQSHSHPLYWIDCGNSNDKGQVLVGRITNEWTKDFNLKSTSCMLSNGGVYDVEDDDTPSCSLAEALLKQDLFINTTIANYAGQYVWQIVRKGVLRNQGVFVNLETMKNSTIKLKGA